MINRRGWVLDILQEWTKANLHDTAQWDSRQGTVFIFMFYNLNP